MRKDFNLETGKKNTLRITTFGNGGGETKTIILVHGFKGFKDWGFGPYLGEYFADRGYYAITFNFSHNGVGESLTEFKEPEKFAQNTFSLEIEELEEIIEAYKAGRLGGNGKGKIGLLGHSRGGGISILTASGREDISAVAVWASVSTFDRYSDRQKVKWREKGVFEVMNTRTKEVMRLNITLLEDLEKNKARLSIKEKTTELKAPFLVVHGEQDLAVPAKEAELLYSWHNGENKQLLIVPNTGHTFDMVHPFAGSNEKFDKITKHTEEFFNKNLI
jgi:uncharacterized protein